MLGVSGLVFLYLDLVFLLLLHGLWVGWLGCFGLVYFVLFGMLLWWLGWLGVVGCCVFYG